MKKTLGAHVLVSACTLAITISSILLACSSSTTSSSPDDSGTAADSSTTDSGTGADSAVATNAVVVESNKFVPTSLTVKVGDTVTWTWEGGEHDVVSGSNCTSDGSWNSALQSTVGATFTHTFTTAGSFDYYCTPHCVSFGMKGTIVVE